MARANLGGYTGMVNFETIDARIIEVHLRFSDQWPDLYGAGWTEAMVRLYADGVWDYADDDRKDGYSVVLFGPHGLQYWHPDPDLIAELLKHPALTSIQITFHEDKPAKAHSMPPGGFRLAIINGWDLEAGRKPANAWRCASGRPNASSPAAPAARPRSRPSFASALVCCQRASTSCRAIAGFRLGRGTRRTGQKHGVSVGRCESFRGTPAKRSRGGSTRQPEACGRGRKTGPVDIAREQKQWPAARCLVAFTLRIKDGANGEVRPVSARVACTTRRRNAMKRQVPN